MHDMMVLTSVIHSTRDRIVQLGKDIGALEQKMDDVDAFNRAIRSYHVAMVALALTILFGGLAVLTAWSAMPLWWAVGGISWGLFTGGVRAHYRLRTFF